VLQLLFTISVEKYVINGEFAMSNDDDFEIKILNEEPKAATPQSSKSQAPAPIPQKAAALARRAWESDGRKQLTNKAKDGAGKVLAKGNQVIQEKVVEAAQQQAREQLAATQEKLRQTDWKAAAQQGAAGGLRWLSRQINQLAQRFNATEKPPPHDDGSNK
jgi:hypothetical protein